MPLTPSAGEGQRLLRILVVIAGFIAFVLVIACLSWGRAVLIPVALAILFSFLLQPVVGLFQRTGLNRPISVLLVVALAGSLFAGLGWVIAAEVTRLARDLRHNEEYKQNIKQKIDDLRGAGEGGILDDLQATVNDIMEFGKESQPAGTPEPLVVKPQEASSLKTFQSALEPLLAPLGSGALVIVLVVFMLLKYEDLRDRIIGLAGSGPRLTTTTRAVGDAGQRMSRYLLMQLIINGSCGLAFGVGLFLIGVPYAFLWGFMGAVLRYVPYVGSWVAAFFPIIISLVAFPGWLRLCLVVCLFLILELLSNLVLEPLLYGQSIGVSEVALLLASGFWTWLWGPIGLVLATPLTVCIIVLGRHFPQLQFFALLMGNKPSLEKHASYYQRLLARDQEGAMELAEAHAREQALDTVYDEVFVPALLLARRDRKDGILEAEDDSFILQATREILDVLLTEREAPAKNRESRTRGEAGKAQVLVFGCPAHHEAEELIVQMLQRLMRPTGCRVEVISTKTLSSEVVARIGQETPPLVFIAVLPGGLRQARYQCALFRREFPGLHIVVGYWGKKGDFDRVLVRLRQAGVSYLTTSLLQSRARITSLTEAATEVSAEEEAILNEPAESRR